MSQDPSVSAHRKEQGESPDHSRLRQGSLVCSALGRHSNPPDRGPRTVEIKNIAIENRYRGRGIGRAAIACLVTRARDCGSDRLLVGTADSSGRTIEFYHSCGFQETGRIPGFFGAYPEPVIEDGLQAHDMIRFEMIL